MHHDKSDACHFIGNPRGRVGQTTSVAPSLGRRTLANQRNAPSEVDIDGVMSEFKPMDETSGVAQSDEIVK